MRKYRIIQRGKVYVVQQLERFIFWTFWSDMLDIDRAKEHETVEDAEETVAMLQERNSRKDIVIKEY